MSKNAILDSSTNQVFRIRFLSFETIGKGKNATLKVKCDFPYLKFTMPQNMSAEDGFKVISYIKQNMTISEGLPENSFASARATDVMLNTFGFTRVFDDEKPCVDLFVIEGNKKQKLGVEWFTENVEESEVKEIYEKRNLKFPRILTQSRNHSRD